MQGWLSEMQKRFLHLGRPTLNIGRGSAVSGVK